MQHGAAGPGGAGVHAPHVGVGADAGNDLLVLGQHRQRPHLIPQGGGTLKVQRLGGIVHLGCELRRHLPQPSLEQPHSLSDAAAVLGSVRAVGTAEAVAPADVVIQAGAFPADILREPAGAGGQPQGGTHRVDGLPRLAAAAEGPKVPGAVLRGTGHQRKTGVFGRFIQPYKGVALVILQQNVVAGHVPLDEGVFQNEGLELRADDDGVEPIHLRHHAAGLAVVGGGVLKVLAHPVFQFFGLAYVDDLPRFVHHQIDAGQQRQLVGFGPQLVLRHGGTSLPGCVFPSIARRNGAGKGEGTGRRARKKVSEEGKIIRRKPLTRKIPCSTICKKHSGALGECAPRFGICSSPCRAPPFARH